MCSTGDISQIHGDIVDYLAEIAANRRIVTNATATQRHLPTKV